MITSKVELITPSLAAEYLKMNTDNYRTPSNSLINAYAEDMRTGNWENNGEPISFRENGTLFNGQHRLQAVIKADTAVSFLVVRGIPNEVKIADWGKTRTINSWGKQEGLVVSAAIIGTSRIIIMGSSGGTVSKGVQSKYISENYDDLREAERISSTFGSKGLGRRTPMVLAVYVCRSLGLVNDSIMEDFFKVLNSGTVSANEARDPSAPLTLYRQITKQYEGKYATRQGIIEQYNLTIQAIIDYKKNKNRRICYKLTDAPNTYLQTIRISKGYLQEVG